MYEANISSFKYMTVKKEIRKIQEKDKKERECVK